MKRSSAVSLRLIVAALVAAIALVASPAVAGAGIGASTSAPGVKAKMDVTFTATGGTDTVVGVSISVSDTAADAWCAQVHVQIDIAKGPDPVKELRACGKGVTNGAYLSTSTYPSLIRGVRIFVYQWKAKATGQSSRTATVTYSG